MFAAMIGAHAVCDYPLQGDFLARAKNRKLPIPGVPWWQALGAHASIHGLAVGIVTGIWWIGLLEAASHFVIDDLKCAGHLSFNQDQAAHVVCKLAWVVLAMQVIP